jgi:hypothetical protein
LFIHTTDKDHDAFNHIISWVAMLEIVVTLFAAWAAKAWRKTERARWNAVVIWGVVCALLMFPVSTLLWKFLPKLQFMQFPWRWLLCLSMIFTIFVTASLKRWWMRGAVFLLGIVVIAGGWRFIQPPWWDNASDLREMQDNMTDRIGYEGTDEYTPTGADPSVINKDAANVAVTNVAVNGPAHASIHVIHWSAESKLFTADMSFADQIVLRLFYYPAWKVTVNGRLAKTSELETTGQMLVPVESGMNRVQITFIRTWDRAVGGWISIIACGLLVCWRVLQ